MKTTKMLTILVLALALAAEVANAATINQAPIAYAGLPRYAATDPVQLDGTGSYDPDSSGSLSYLWRQIAGPPVVIIDANTPTPTIGGSFQGTGRSGLIAHWALDETEGSIAYDTAGGKDGTLNGDPAWQSTSGQIAGALQFDGIDDYVSTPFMLRAVNAVFSVFAWVKGGMPGQVVFSQAGASDWLGADTTNGSLMTELKFLGKPSRALQSQTVITDGNWYRIGLVWDGSNRILYVDDVEVASDTYDKGWLIGGLQIGAGKNLDPGTFFSGLIDDVRIYNRALAKMGGFDQTDEIQECEFELVVSDGELTSPPDTVKVIIVPDFGQNFLRHVNPPFDPNIPTLIVFGGGDCVTGSFTWQPDENAIRNRTINSIHFHDGYMPDKKSDAGWRTYYGCADMIIVYLSSVAPDYKMPIQTVGVSTGGQPAVDAGIRLNATYRDARYAVNRVTLEDAGINCRSYKNYSNSIAAFVASSVDGEQCWLDNYVSKFASFYPNVLNVGFDRVDHSLAYWWYESSWTNAELNKFNNGVVAGAYWSVIGPGKNLQLALTPDTQTYEFKWYGSTTSGYMDFYDEPNYPGRLPEPVTLFGPEDGALVDANGAVLSCKESENAVGYQLLFGRDPYHMVYLFSDTPSPPAESVTAFPFEQCWWTVRAYDEYGSTIHADPVHIKAESVIAQTIENATTGQTYASIQRAINDALAGDAIVISPGVHQYLEHINLKGKSLTVRSTNPDDPATVAATVINGGNQGTVVTVSDTEETDCVLAGLTILGGTVGVSCRAESVTIRNCTIESNGPIAIEFWEGFEPRIIDCTVLGYVYDHRLLVHWALDETEGSITYDSIGDNDGTLNGEPIWQPAGGIVDGALELDGIDDYVSTLFVLNPAEEPFSVFAWIKGGVPGQVIISQADITIDTRVGPSTTPGSTWLGASLLDGRLMTGLMDVYFGPLESESVITDDQWHHIGLVYDITAMKRRLYVDGTEVVVDAGFVGGAQSSGGLYIGASQDLDPDSFFSGLIDDVRIYDAALSVEEIEAMVQ